MSSAPPEGQTGSFLVWRRAAASFALIVWGAFSAHADVSLPRILTDHMVVQRERPIHIWGRAEPGEHVSVTLAQDVNETSADALGRWSVYLKPQSAGGPFEISVAARNKLVLRDVLVGDVWMASGQSNMEFKLHQGDNAESEIAAAKYPNIRFFQVERKTSAYPLEDVASKGWLVCNPETASDFSAVAYFFGRDLQRDVNVPIGLIDTSWGGTPLAAFTPMTAIAKDAALMPVFAQWGRMMDNETTTMLQIDQESRKYDESVSKAKADGKPIPTKKWHAEPASWGPAAIYNGMIAPVTPFAIRGAIWYQGESDADKERAPVYAHLFKTMIATWRQAWGVGSFPFLFVQLPNFIGGPNNAWPELREAQFETLSLTKTGMAITVDLGDPGNIHPTHKQEVGARLARLAQCIGFGEKLEDSGPLFREATPEGGKIRVWFDHFGGGLHAKGGSLKNFEVAGADRRFEPAEATIEADGRSVLAMSAAVTQPLYVRYAWSDNPQATLFNDQGLPASPFRSGK